VPRRVFGHKKHEVSGERLQLHEDELNTLYSLVQILFLVLRPHSGIMFTYLLTPWCWILFEKLIVTQLIRKYPAFLWNPKVHYSVHTSPPLDPILSPLNPVRSINPYLPNVHLNVILPLSLGLPSVLLPSGLPTKTL
jgi:hypothetical protein